MTMMTERDFLKFLALEQFNRQFRRKINYKTCSIKSIPPIQNKTHGYEIETIRSDDFVRLRIYFNLDTRTVLQPYRTELTGAMVEGLGDETYVSVGSMAKHWVDSDTYRFRWMQDDPNQYDFIHGADGDLLQFMTGEYIRYVEQSNA